MEPTIPIGIQSVSVTKPLPDPHHSDHVPVYICLDGVHLTIRRDEPVIDQINRNTERPETQVKVIYEAGKIVLSHVRSGGLPLYFPEGAPETIDTSKLKGDVAFGVFGLIQNDQGEILVIQKQRENFWYIPGGLVEPKDGTIKMARDREVNEETGVQIDEKGSPIYLYESITKSRHNLMQIDFIHYHGHEELSFTPNEEIKDCKWIKPAEFLANYINDPKYSVPSMRIAINHIRDRQMQDLFSNTDWDKEAQEQYYNSKKMYKDIDETLFDFCFIEVEKKAIYESNDVLINKAANRAKEYMPKSS